MSPLSGGVSYYASTTADGSGDGSLGAPFTIGQAMAFSFIGDTIWLRGGTYTGDFTQSGTTTGTIRSYPGELAVIDGSLTVNGNHFIVRDLCVLNSSTARTGLADAGTRPDSITVKGNYVQIVNNLLCDGGNGVSWYAGAVGGLMEGNLVLDPGWYGADRGNGHGVYTQNDGTAVKTIKRNLFAHVAAAAVSSKAEVSKVDNFHIAENTVVRPNTRDASGSNLQAFDLYSRHTANTGIEYRGNRSYVDPAKQGWWIGWLEDPGDLDILIDGNWHHGGIAIDFNYSYALQTVTNNVLSASPGTQVFAESSVSPYTAPTTRVYSGNKYHSDHASPFKAENVDKTFAQWKTLTGQDADSTCDAALPAAQQWVDVNEHETKRGRVTVWNPTSDASVTVDLSTILANGDSYYVYNALNPLAGPIASGTYTVPVSLTTALTNRTPAGLTALANDPKLCVYEVRTVATWVAAA